jgi:hypothetical protein
VKAAEAPPASGTATAASGAGTGTSTSTGAGTAGSASDKDRDKASFDEDAAPDSRPSLGSADVMRRIAEARRSTAAAAATPSGLHRLPGSDESAEGLSAGLNVVKKK